MGVGKCTCHQSYAPLTMKRGVSIWDNKYCGKKHCHNFSSVLEPQIGAAYNK